MNFYGASKGNPGQVGCGGIVRDWGGRYLRIFLFYCGHTSNNMVEFLVLERGLIMATEVGYSKLHIEGDLW